MKAWKFSAPHLKGVNEQSVSPHQRKTRLLPAFPVGLLALISLMAVLTQGPFAAETISVRQPEGSLHAFLVVQTLDGKTIAEGDLIQTMKGATVRIQMSLHFHDGSLYEETSEFSQQGQFRLLSNHLSQKGPSFKQELERSIDTSTGQVVLRYKDDNGQEKTESQHMDLPADLANGMFLVLMKNIDPARPQTTVSVLGGEPKPRLLQVIITPEHEAPFLIGRSKREGTEYDLKPKIEGAAGVIAPLVGKEPADTHVWVFGGSTPVVLKSEGPLEPGGPIWRIQNVGPSWPSNASRK